MVNRWSAKPAPAAAPTTKECGYCKTEIPIKATRCPNCTSQLQAA
jgi:large conductance mechanosensitive channel